MMHIKTDILCENHKCDGVYNVISDLGEDVQSARKGDAMWQETLLLRCPKCHNVIFAPKEDFVLVEQYEEGGINQIYTLR